MEFVKLCVSCGLNPVVENYWDECKDCWEETAYKIEVENLKTKLEEKEVFN